jgi:hypothetical protein
VYLNGSFWGGRRMKGAMKTDGGATKHVNAKNFLDLLFRYKQASYSQSEYYIHIFRANAHPIPLLGSLIMCHHYNQALHEGKQI